MLKLNRLGLQRYKKKIKVRTPIHNRSLFFMLTTKKTTKSLEVSKNRRIFAAEKRILRYGQGSKTQEFHPTLA